MNLLETMPFYLEGLLAISDLRGNYKSALLATKEAEDNFQYIVFMGNLVDGGDQPFETLEHVYSLLERNKAVCIISEKDAEWYFHIKQKKEFTNACMCDTISKVHESLISEFEEMYISIFEHDNSHYTFTIDQWHFASGSIPLDLLVLPCENISKENIDIIMGKNTSEGKEKYQWVDEVPRGYKVIVGNDSCPFGKKFDSRPEIVCGAQRGLVIFSDTGCGEREDGVLTATSLLYSEGEITFERFITYK